MPFNTGNSVPSNAGEDLNDNTQALDKAMNSTDDTFLDRTGVARKTWRAVETEASAASADAVDAASQAETYKNQAETARDTAVVVVTGGTATLEPEPGKIPIADSQGVIDLGWINRDILRQAVRANANMVWDPVSDDYSREYITSGVTPTHERMRRCVVADDGSVAYYLDRNDSTKKVDGTPANLSGADGQVMVEIPKFYVRIHQLFNLMWKREISETPRSGFVVHPAFAIGGTLQYDSDVGMWHYVGNTGEREITYIGAYQASVYDTSGSEYIDGLNLDNNDSRVDTGADTLSSVSGKYPMVGLTRDQFRSLASNRGAGWSQWSFWQLQAVKLLFFIEYGTFDGQAALAIGNHSVSSGYPGSSSDQTDSPHSIAGKSDSIGNGSGGVDNSSRDTAWMSYRGVENLWGNAWQWCDGWNMYNHQYHICNDPSLFADDTTTNYPELGEPVPAKNGYIRNVQHQTLGDVPSDVSGNSSTAFADHLWQNVGWRVALVGGYATGGANVGPSCVGLHYSSGSRYRIVAGRLARI